MFKFNEKLMCSSAFTPSDLCYHQAQNESGRSMVEMLGVLAVIGVLSVAGVAGFKTAIEKHRANELLSEASKRAVIIAAQRQMEQTPSVADFENVLPWGTFSDDVKVDDTNGGFELTVSGVDKNICQHMKNITSTNPQINGDCDGSSDLKFVYKNDLSAVDFVFEETVDEYNEGCIGEDCTSANLYTCHSGQIYDEDETVVASCPSGYRCTNGSYYAETCRAGCVSALCETVPSTYYSCASHPSGVGMGIGNVYLIDELAGGTQSLYTTCLCEPGSTAVSVADICKSYYGESNRLIVASNTESDYCFDCCGRNDDMPFRRWGNDLNEVCAGWSGYACAADVYEGRTSYVYHQGDRIGTTCYCTAGATATSISALCLAYRCSSGYIYDRGGYLATPQMSYASCSSEGLIGSTLTDFFTKKYICGNSNWGAPYAGTAGNLWGGNRCFCYTGAKADTLEELCSHYHEPVCFDEYSYYGSSYQRDKYVIKDGVQTNMGSSYNCVHGTVVPNGSYYCDQWGTLIKTSNNSYAASNAPCSSGAADSLEELIGGSYWCKASNTSTSGSWYSLGSTFGAGCMCNNPKKQVGYYYYAVGSSYADVCKGPYYCSNPHNDTGVVYGPDGSSTYCNKCSDDATGASFAAVCPYFCSWGTAVYLGANNYITNCTCTSGATASDWHLLCTN